MKHSPDPAALAAEAASAAARRREQYPALVAAGRIGADEAADEIRIWSAIAADWAWVAGHSGAAMIDGTTPAERAQACAVSVGRFDRALAKAIAQAPDAVRADCTEGRDLADLRAAHGEAAAPILAILAQRDAMEAMRDLYRAPASFAALARLRAEQAALMASTESIAA